MYLKLFLLVFFITLGNAPKENASYEKEYYQPGIIKSEGWVRNGLKDGYWKFYHPNGKLSEKGHFKKGQRQDYWYFYTENGVPEQEGHYKNGEMTDWWLFFDSKGRVSHKCQLDMGIKNGYCLQYVNEELTSAEKYQNGKQIKKWTSFSSFRRENNLSDLK